MADEWYTPEEIITFVHEVLGYIDLDPCSSRTANEVVGAERIWTIEDDSLTKEWDADTVFMNPPYSKPKPFIRKFVDAFDAGTIDSGIMLLKGDPSTTWWELIRNYPHVFVPYRLKFRGPSKGAATFPSGLIYLGDDVEGFKSACKSRGWVPMNPME